MHRNDGIRRRRRAGDGGIRTGVMELALEAVGKREQDIQREMDIDIVDVETRVHGWWIQRHRSSHCYWLRRRNQG